MNTRRFRDRSQAFLTFRWLGWVLLMMFVLVQTASATQAGAPAHSNASAAVSNTLPQASAQFDPQTNEVTLEARAPATLWNAAPRIDRRSLVVYENNIRQPLEDLKVLHTPLSIGVLLEHGGRYHVLNDAAAEAVSHAAQELISSLEPNDKVTLWTYGDTVQPLAASAENAIAVQPMALHLPVPPSSETNFYDAMLTVLPKMQQLPGHKVLMVVSSGFDTFSQADFSQVLNAAEHDGVPICAINIGRLLQSTLTEGADAAPYGHLQWTLASNQLKRLTRVSGCRAVTPESSLELPAAYDALLSNLRLRYVIRYRSSALDLPGTRHVKVEWVEGTRPPIRVAGTSFPVGSGIVLADARYTLPAPAAWKKPTAFTWSLPHSDAHAVQIPLKMPEDLGIPVSASHASLMAATALNDPTREALGAGCSSAPCPSVLN